MGKKERKAKNELQRLRNIARQKKVKVPTVGVVPSSVKDGGKSSGLADELKGAAEFAKSSTASLGKFQPSLHKKLEEKSKLKGQKRKFESNTGSSNTEKERNLGILESINSKQPGIIVRLSTSKRRNILFS